MIVDANVLLFAVNSASPFHRRAAEWLTEQLNGPRRVGLPWQSLMAFVRIATHPRAFDRPMTAADAWSHVRDWLSAPVAWVPEPGPRYADILGELLVEHDVRGNLVPDAQLAAVAVEHGLVVVSADADFARFSGVRWDNPLSR